MNVNPSAAASVAGVGKAVAKGGTIDDQANQARANQAKQTSPGGKSEAIDQLDAGDHTQDRSGDGRQVLDTFERNQEQREENDVQIEREDDSDHDGHLDFQA